MSRRRKRRKSRSRPQQAPSRNEDESLADVLLEIAEPFTSARKTLLSFSNECGHDVFDEETRLALLQIAIQMWRGHPEVPELVAVLVALEEERQRHLEAMRSLRLRFIDLEYDPPADVHLGSIDPYRPLIRAIRFPEDDLPLSCTSCTAAVDP